MSYEENICLVCPNPFDKKGGVQNHTLNLKLHMQAVGKTVQIVAPAPGKPDSDVVLIGKSIPVSVNGSKGSANFSIRFPEIPNFLKRGRFDIVHLHNMDVIGFLWSRRIAKTAHSLGIPVFLTFHGCLDANKIASLAPYPMAMLYKNLFTGAIAVSPAAMNALSHFSIPKKIIPNGIDTERFTPSLVPESSVYHRYEKSGKIVLFVGRLEKRKGILELLRAWRFVVAMHSDAALIVVGEGPLEQDARALVEIHHLQASVHFAGSVPDNLLPSYYALTHIVCAPSLYGESFGLVLLEGMAMAKPVVAGNNMGYREILRTTPELLVNPRDPQELAHSITNLLENPVLYNDLRERCFARATEPQFSWTTITQQVLETYDEFTRG